jgi:hypothetical protein
MQKVSKGAERKLDGDRFSSYIRDATPSITLPRRLSGTNPPLAGPPRKQRFPSPKRGAHPSVRTLIRRSIEGFPLAKFRVEFVWRDCVLEPVILYPDGVYLIICGCPRLNHLSS